ncbi:MAG: UDP-3-O-(3-hydroxymyristoyl)glucosamine N-acyltransferase [Ectothiorhodospiraceae bacterium]|nr:UDP-3-O-(3-hydroxymyristoyl)glucosamine N-acyltransferase [Ectothiorhodospiraceae bacterium]MCH8504396.1 UDP-3-O-(3-hydroxymyristoyl)glucosamine N-acyltransferase [Ectothiorhodospiraceae bacterium]
MDISLGELSDTLGLELRGDAEAAVSNAASLASAGPRSLSFLADPRHRKHLAETRAACVILSESMAAESPVPVLIAANPHLAFARALALLYPQRREPVGVHPTAWIHPEATLGENVSIGPHVSVGRGSRLGDRVQVGPGCVIGEDVAIDDDTQLVANVTVWDRCRIGKRCKLHPGSVVGADGFGFALDAGIWYRVPQVGAVRVGDDVDVGCNTTIDRGALDDTVIGDGVKLDNLVQIAHNCRIGDHTVFAGCAGVAGSTTIGKHCAIGGASAVNGHITLGDGVQVTGMSQVTKSLLEPGIYSSGTAVEPSRDWRKNVARFHQLDDMARRLRRVEQKLDRGSTED